MSRQTELAQIHIAKKALALDEHSYRMVLQRVTGPGQRGGFGRGPAGQGAGRV